MCQGELVPKGEGGFPSQRRRGRGDGEEERCEGVPREEQPIVYPIPYVTSENIYMESIIQTENSTLSVSVHKHIYNNKE